MSVSLNAPKSTKLDEINGVLLSTYQNCLIEVWQAEGKDLLGTIRKLDEMTEALSKQYPEGITFLIVLAEGSMFPNSSERKSLEDFFSRWSSKWLAIARTPEGNGLWAIAARGVMVTLIVVQRAQYAEKIFASVAEATKWIAPYVKPKDGLSVEQTAAELEAKVRDLRRRPGSAA